MKKIVFVTIPMQAMKSEQVYKVDGNDNVENKKAVFIPINGILAGLLKKSDDVKIVRIITESATCFSEKNAEKQKEELDGFNKTIGANIRYIDIRAPYEETSATLELRFRELIGALEDDAEIILDMTFGPKTLTPVFFYVLGFAEKFFNADIKNIFYIRLILMPIIIQFLALPLFMT